ncbi:MAG: EAL domain-containing protein, partial [Clostridia bacterium]|nr:EAL domain-containing protein [Clostridia bacterium]
TATVFLIYVIVAIHGHFGRKPERVFYMTATAIDFVLVLSSPLTGWTFYFDQALEYKHGPLMIVLYILAFMIITYTLVLFIRHRKALTTFQLTADVVFVCILMASVIVQALFPELLIESFTVALSFLMLNVSLDNPATYLYRGTYCFNQNAFNESMTEKLNTGVDYTLLCFTFDDMTVDRKRYGDEIYYSLINRVVNCGLKLFGQKRFYILSTGMFAVDLTGMTVEEGIEKLNENLDLEMPTETGKIKWEPHFCVVRPSDYVRTPVDLNRSISRMLFEVFKLTGENVIYDSSTALKNIRREALVLSLIKNAIANDGFEVYYQPIYNRTADKFESVEALVRLKNTDNGYVGPDEFIPIAEKNGLILDVGDIVFEKACRFWRNAKLYEYGIKWMEVNLSLYQLQKISHVDRPIEISKRYGLSPDQINFEITETANVDINSIEAGFNYLHEKGFSFSLDDYGSGYSAALYFATMPFKIVKIDKEILWNSEKKETFRTVLETTVSLIRDTDRLCVVEGVEDEKMVSKLSALGVDFLQGYFYSRPLPQNGLIDFLSKKNGSVSVG